MNREIWQRLLSLESHEITRRRFNRLHSRSLNARRTREINASAKQAREYFRNANASDYTVRPLLSYYGVASLSRALLLMLKMDGGEEGLAQGHGIETVGWREVMSGNAAQSLAHLGNLRIRKCMGLFSDLLKYTKNRNPIHVYSAAVDWCVCYDIPETPDPISVADLFSRIPDLREDYSKISKATRYASVQELTYSNEEGFMAKIVPNPSSNIEETYKGFGYTVGGSGDARILTGDSNTIENEPPMLIHTYLSKMFGSIPSLYISEPFPGGARFSQLCVTYLLSYVLGMLVRYFPTHWISLVQGSKGDSMWPTINLAQQIVEYTYPELVAELIDDIINRADRT